MSFEASWGLIVCAQGRKEGYRQAGPERTHICSLFIPDGFIHCGGCGGGGMTEISQRSKLLKPIFLSL